MKTIIIYASKYGATKQIAELISSCMDDVFLCDINGGGSFSISDYDCVILGSPLTAGNVNKDIKDFALKHTEELKSKRLGLFLSGLQPEQEQEYFERNFSPEILKASKAKAFLGGVFNPDKMGFAARNMIKLITKLKGYTSTIDDKKVKDFAEKMKS